MSNTFLVSDWHLSHVGATKFLNDDGSKMRPFDTVEEMDEALVERHNSVVGPKDKVYVLGDCAINRRGLHHIGRLNGDKVLIKGNHDIFRLEEYTPYFRDIRGYHVMDKLLLAHIPIHPACLERYRGQVHGHLHTYAMKHSWTVGGPKGEKKYAEEDHRYFSVCVERINFTPIPFEKVNDIFKERGL
jgi:calcineurin-like phosphoesterase family protein